jgi:serine protease Do
VALVRGGDMIHLEIRRDGQVREIDVRSGVRPDQPRLARYDTQGGGAPASPGHVLGMSVEPNPEAGLTIDGVRADSDAGEKGLQRGDVILRAGDHATSTPADLTAAVAEARRAGRKDVLLMVVRNGQHSFVPISVEAAKG